MYVYEKMLEIKTDKLTEVPMLTRESAARNARVSFIDTENECTM